MRFVILFSFYFICDGLAELDTQWWRHTNIYQILPFSYKDSDGDGIGDLKGIISKLDHLNDLKIETIHLTPMYPTELRDIGYDIIDYYDIEPKFGTMADFDELVREMKKRDMKLVLDLVINHSSHKHDWFQKSIDGIEPYKDFYIWKDSKGYDSAKKKEKVPNKWVSVFSGESGSAWKWNEKRKQFYLHQFLEEQPDFNLRNPIVEKELIEIIKFWLDKGIAGFRLDAVNFYLEDEYFRDDAVPDRQLNQPETYRFVHRLRTFLDNYNKEHGGIERIFMAESHCNWDCVKQYYDKENYNMTHFPYTYNLKRINTDITAKKLHQLTTKWIENLPENAISAWIINDHDGDRIGSIVRLEYMDITTIASMLLPGVACTYYGQEIGMMNGYIHENQTRDHSGGGTRDPARLLMQWDNTLNAGFSNNIQTFLPVNSDYYYRNVESQRKQNISHYNMFKDLSNLRETDTFKYGDFESKIYSDLHFVFSRSYKDRMFVVIISFDPLYSFIDLLEVIPKFKNQKVSVIAASTNAGYVKGYQPQSNFFMRPFSCVVFEVINLN